MEIVKKKYCIGCGNCKNICPKKAIIMRKDEEGFFYPKIIEEKCIKCNRCKTICPILFPFNNKIDYSVCNVKAGWLKNENELMTVTSGGISTSISNWFIKNNGSVAGVIYSDDFSNSEYILTNNIQDVERMKNSKYIQARKNDIFAKIKENLLSNKTLFIGTPCDVAALKVYVNNEQLLNNLFTIELICHGPTSELVHEKFLKENNISNIKEFNVRNKKNGWEKPTLYIKYEDKITIVDFYSSDYGKGFLNFTRPSCFNCKFKGDNRHADITVGDYWGLNQKEEFYNEKGVSVIFINTDKGNLMIGQLEDFILYNTTYDAAIAGNQNLVKRRKQPYIRRIFKRNLLKHSLNYSCNHLNSNIANFLKFIKKILKKIIPKKILLFIKKICKI